ncbi:MAG TPA: hypothetical protein ENN21_04160 [Spirochaetes bacterium]|nr:hypothetical protein [Spirochaetota bacterium]
MRKTPVEVTVREIEEILEDYFDAASPLNYALKIVGHPGVGKSAVVKQVAERKNLLFLDTRLAFKENVDLGGYPVPDHQARRMVYYRPKFIPPEEVPEGYKGIVWFLDESNRAHPTVIQTLFQIITEHTCGEHRLPERTAIILAGNLGDTDGTTITEFDDAALDGRLAIFRLRPSAEGLHPSVMRYITLFPERLWDEERIDPNPRGWHQVSNALVHSFGLSTGEETAARLAERGQSTMEKLLAALVGAVAAHEFLTELAAPRAVSTSDILEGSPDKLALLKSDGIPPEDLLWGLSGAVAAIREKSAALNDCPGPDDLAELANLLRFIGYARADTRLSFFYLLLRQCGIFTRVPAAIDTLADAEERRELKSRFEALLDS